MKGAKRPVTHCARLLAVRRFVTCDLPQQKDE